MSDDGMWRPPHETFKDAHDWLREMRETLARQETEADE